MAPAGRLAARGQADDPRAQHLHTYKIPTANDAPPVFHTRLYDNVNAQDTIHRSKAVGEPPLLLGFSVFFAIRDAISAVGGHRIDPPLRAPATAEAILDAVDAVRAGSGG